MVQCCGLAEPACITNPRAAHWPRRNGAPGGTGRQAHGPNGSFSPVPGVSPEEARMLKIEKLTKVYPDGTRALNEVSLTVPDGQFVVIIGLSGSGKSTLMRCINRLIEPTTGKVWLDDMDITAANPTQLRHIRRNIGMIFQQFNLVNRSSVLTNVLSGRLGYAATLPSLFRRF